MFPKNALDLLGKLLEKENAEEYACGLFENLSVKDDDRLRAMFKSLRENGYIGTYWANNVPYIIEFNEKAYEYKDNEMNQKRTSKSRFDELIDMIPEIKKLFVPYIFTRIKPANRPPIMETTQRIHDNPKYMRWRAEIESELCLFENNEVISKIYKAFKKMDNGFTELQDFEVAEVNLLALKKYLPDMVTNEQIKKSSCSHLDETLCEYILKALVNLQRNGSNKEKSEDEINDSLRSLLNMKFIVLDQTRQGMSESGKGKGEVDFLLNSDNNMPIAIMEALKANSLNKEYIDAHIDKVLTKYDPLGCLHVFLLIYYNGKNLDSFWTRYIKHMYNYAFPYEKETEITQVKTGYAEIKQANIGLNRKGSHVVFYSFVIQIV